MKPYVKIGNYIPETDESEAEIDRGATSQGFVFKDGEAFAEYPDRVCYIPENDDTLYTRRDFLNICEGSEEMAGELFRNVDWQHPETLFDEYWDSGEVERCKYCGSFYWSYNKNACDRCSALYETSTTTQTSSAPDYTDAVDILKAEIAKEEMKATIAPAGSLADSYCSMQAAKLQTAVDALLNARHSNVAININVADHGTVREAELLYTIQFLADVAARNGANMDMISEKLIENDISHTLSHRADENDDNVVMNG